jgi:hypothetical protein
MSQLISGNGDRGAPSGGGGSADDVDDDGSGGGGSGGDGSTAFAQPAFGLCMCVVTVGLLAALLPFVFIVLLNTTVLDCPVQNVCKVPETGQYVCFDIQSADGCCGVAHVNCTTQGTTCFEGACVGCPVGLLGCFTAPPDQSFVCVNASSDSTNCGACFNFCSLYERCAAGVCVPSV